MKRLNFLGTLLLSAALSPLALAQVKIVAAPRIESTSKNTVVIAWSTDAPASAAVRYGTDPKNLDQVAQSSWGGAQRNDRSTHQVTISNLKPNTTYYYKVESGDAKGSGTSVHGQVQSFMTGADGGLKRVTLLDGPRVEQTTDTTAQVAWTTDSQASAAVRYGTDRNNLDKIAQGEWGGAANGGGHTHRVTIRDLKPSTTYFFKVESGDAKDTGTSVHSDVQTFATAAAGQTNNNASANVTAQGQKAQLQAGPIAQNVTDKSATIWWMTSDNARATVLYGKDRNNLDRIARSTGRTNHQVSLTGLEPGTTYYYVVRSRGNQIKAEGSFQTETAEVAADTKKLRIINGPVIEYVTPDTAIVAWSTNARSSSTVRYGTDENNLSQTATAPWGQETHRVTISNLKPNTRYTFVVESSQAEGTGTMAKSNPAYFSTVPQGAQAMRNPQPR